MFTAFKRFLTLMISILFTGLLIACGQTDTAAPAAPFTNMAWESATPDIIAEEGEDFPLMIPSTEDFVIPGPKNMTAAQAPSSICLTAKNGL